MATRQRSRLAGGALARLGVPVIPWSRFYADFDWRQGEHVSMIGTTGSGKSTLAMTLLPLRAYRAIVCVKPADALMSRIARDEEYHVTTVWPPKKDVDRLIVWPPNRGDENMGEQADTVRRALRNLYREGKWCVYLDELEWLTSSKYLGLESVVNPMWQHGRSLGLSLMVGAQRPRHVPMLAYDQATHLFLWQNSDRYNRERMGDLGGMDSKRISWVMARLPKHTFLYVNTRDGQLAVSRAPSKG